MNEMLNKKKIKEDYKQGINIRLIKIIKIILKNYNKRVNFFNVRICVLMDQ